MNLSSYHRPAKIICLIWFLLWAWLLIHKYYSLGYYDWDFAFFSQAMWSLSHGSMHSSLFDINFFSNHANLMALVLVPLYKVFPHPLTLLFLKLISFCVASYIIYLISEEKLGQNISLVILYLYWLCPSNIYGLEFEFDFENLAPAFIMLTFFYFAKEKWMPFIISSLFLIIIKENMPLIIMAFGIFGLFTKSDKISWGLIPAALGAFSFYVLAFIFVPLMGGHGLGQHPYASHYSDINTNLLHHPIQALRQIITIKKLKWLESLFGPLFLSLLSPGILFLGSPIILQHFLSNASQEHTIFYNYSMTIIPFIFIAFIHTLSLVKEKFTKNKLYLILIISVATSIINLAGETETIKTRYLGINSPDTAAYCWQLLNLIPPQAPVVASFRFLPELSQRPDVYSFHKIYDPSYQNKNYSYKLPSNVHYALIDYNDSWLLSRFDLIKQPIRLSIRNFWIQGSWKVKSAATGIALFER